MKFTHSDWSALIVLLSLLLYLVVRSWLCKCLKYPVPPPLLCGSVFDRVLGCYFILCVLLLTLSVWLCAIKDSQLAPHHITSRLGTVDVVDFWTTNPAYISYSNESLITATGVVQVDVPVTNFYWHVWPMFKK